MLTDERYKQLMEDVGMPDSRSLLMALKQAAMEAALEAKRTTSASLPDCDICGNKQIELGALRFSAPVELSGHEGLWCKKTHVCKDCDEISYCSEAERAKAIVDELRNIALHSTYHQSVTNR